MVEHLTLNQGVESSILSAPTMLAELDSAEHLFRKQEGAGSIPAASFEDLREVLSGCCTVT